VRNCDRAQQWAALLDELELACTEPPGLTVQVAAARAVVVPRTAARAAAVVVNTIRECRFLMCLSVLSGETAQ
jgi:hypothetical protein